MKKATRRQVRGTYGIVDVNTLPSGRINVFTALTNRGHQVGDSVNGADLTTSEVRRVIAALQASIR